MKVEKGCKRDEESEKRCNIYYNTYLPISNIIAHKIVKVKDR